MVVVVGGVVVVVGVVVDVTMGRYTTSISSSFSILLGLEGGAISCSLDSVSSNRSTFSTVGLMSYIRGGLVGTFLLTGLKLKGLASYKNNKDSGFFLKKLRNLTRNLRKVP